MTATPTTTAFGRILDLYRLLRQNRNLQLLLSGQIVSMFGDWLYIVALVVLVYKVSGSATVVAVLTFVRLLPYALFLPFTGLLADRSNRKLQMIVADVGRAVCMLGLLLVSGPTTLWIAFPVVFCTSALSSLFRPAMSSVLPAVVANRSDLLRANSLMSQIVGLSTVLGPALGGLLLVIGEPRTAFLLNAASYLLSSLSLLFLRIPPRVAVAEHEAEGWVDETLRGFRFLFRENEGVLAAFTLSVAAGSLLGGAFWSLSVVLAEHAFGLGSQGTGYLNAAYGVGGLLGGLLTDAITARFQLKPAFITGTAIASIIAGVFGLSPAGWLPFVMIAALGATDVLVEICGRTVVQTATPEHMLGRVFGAFDSILILTGLVGALVAGPLIDGFGPRISTVLLSLAGLVILAACYPRLRRLEEVLGVRIFIRQVPMLASLPQPVLDDLASRMRQEQIADGATIMQEGAAGDRLYIIKDGEVQVAAHGATKEERSLATLHAMDYFGEIALLRDVPRTATVRARGAVTLYSLSREDFAVIMQRSEAAQHAITEVSDARLQDTRNRLLLSRV